MDQIEALFPIPMMRSPGLLNPALNAAVVASIRSARIENNREKLRWTVKEIWTNMLEKGGSQTLHSHANSFVSGILYLTPSHPACKTVFVRPPGGNDFSFRHHTRSAALGPFNAGKYVLPEAEPGDLVLFPSYLYHEVPRNQGDQRITIAFNAIPDSLDCWGYRINFTP